MKYKRKAETVDAVQFTGRNFRALDLLVGSNRRTGGVQGFFAIFEINSVKITLEVGDYLIKDDSGVIVKSGKLDFKKKFEPLNNNIES